MVFEIFVGFFCGYLLGKAVGSISNLAGKPDKVLAWDPQSLGYRPVHYDSKLEPGKKYLICYEVQSGDQKR